MPRFPFGLPLGMTLVAALAGCTTTVKDSAPFASASAQERTPSPREESSPTRSNAGNPDGGRTDGRGGSARNSGSTSPGTAPRDLKNDSDLEMLVEVDGLLQKWVTALNLANDGDRESAATRLRPIAEANHTRLLGFLRGDDLEARIVAAGALGFSSRPDAIPVLLAALDDGNPYVRSNAALSLGLIGNRDVPREPFLNLLTDSEAPVRGSAAFALSRLVRHGVDTEAVPVLVDALRDRHFAVRNESVRALAVIGDRRATIPLLETTFRDQYFLIRLNTAVALARLRDPRAIAPLMRALDDTDENIRKAARYSLGEITGAGVEDSDVAWKAWWERNRERIAKDILDGRGTSGTSEVDLGGK